MPVQDDARENQMIGLFNLTTPPDRKRSDIDATLALDGQQFDFELKSTTSGSVSTVRDFGPEHIKKWRNDLHWVFAFYDSTGTKLQYCVYASPADMEPWIAEQESYIAPDIALASSLPSFVNEQMVIDLLGERDVYALQAAQWVMKKQWSRAEYLAAQDRADGYSLARMVEILQKRANYVLRRGSTLNNPHIPKSYFENFEKIVDEHAARLRESVRTYVNSRPMDAATT